MRNVKKSFPMENEEATSDMVTLPAHSLMRKPSKSKKWQGTRKKETISGGDVVQNLTEAEATNSLEAHSSTAVGNAKKTSESDPDSGLYAQRYPASLLDHLTDASTIRKSEFRGFVNLFVIVSIVYIFWNPLISWYERREIFDMSLAYAMFDDFFFLMFMWLKLFLWSFTAYGLHKLYRNKLISKPFHYVLQHATQTLCIFYAVGQCIYNKWPIIPAAFIQFVAVVYFMKMHSFTETNRSFFDAIGTEAASPYYPHNITIEKYCFYLFCPVLVYEPVYPKGPGFRLSYFLKKLCALVASMSVMYLACTSYLIPTMIQTPQMSLLEALLRLLFPLLAIDILVFYIMFECICNLFGELTNFGDREFYQDWWNSTSWDEFSRKWNRPVHAFLLRHIYLEPQKKYAWSQRDATFATFLFSALLHEMILSVCFRLIRMYMFLLMLLQIPLIALGKFYRGRVLGNFIFWAGMIVGVPLLAVAYGREWASLNFSNNKFDSIRLI